MTEKPGEASSKKSNDDYGGALSAVPILEQACYLPTTLDGLPLMGKLSSSSIYGGGGPCYIAAGHGCW
eukprot:1065394-Ditylum_brightwellii.AAC.1